MSGYRNYYDSTFVRSRSSEPSKKVSNEKNPTSRIATKYTGAYTSRDTGAYSSRSETPRVKTTLDKDTSHPPVSYKPIVRTGARSRDPSPVLDKSDKSSSSSSNFYNPNRLYPKSYTSKSFSRESTLSPASSTTNLPKYTGRSSVGREDPVSKYSGRSSISRDELSTPKYGLTRSSKEDNMSSRYASTSRATSKEDLSSGSQKSYINSRFLPKNSVEKSYTAYTRPSNIRTHETSRKNRELLNVLHVQQELERTSRPSSRCSSVTPEDSSSGKIAAAVEKEVAPKDIEMETVTLVTRGTSPNLTKQNPSFLRSRRIEVAKIIEKQVTRPKIRKDQMADKAIQSDRMDDSTKSSRFAGASRISATPWSSFLDMKFSSPNNKNPENQESKPKDSCESPKSLSRTSSTKSVGQSSNKSDSKNKKSNPTSPLLKSKISPPKSTSHDSKKQLPPPIPKTESTNKTNSLSTPNKDFRKSVLNMNPDGTAKKKVGRRSTSVSSAESDNADPDATDVSENLTSCKSYHKSSSSKLPQKISSDKNVRSRRSPSSDVSVSSATVSSSEDDGKMKEKVKLKSAGSSRTSMVLTSADELSSEKRPKPPQSPRLKTDKPENTEAKSFLMRALAPVTNLFKANKTSPINQEKSGSSSGANYVEANSLSDQQEDQASNKVVWILDPSSENTSTQYTCNTSSEPKSAKIVIHRVESMGKPWWEESEISESERQVKSEPIVKVSSGYFTSENTLNQEEVQTPKTMIRNVSSGSKPWWLDENSEVPEGVQTYPGYVEQENGVPQKQTPRHVNSGEYPWWLDNKAQPPDGVQVWNETGQENSQESEWWTEKNNENNQKQNLAPPKTIMRPVDSGEIAWWLDSNAQPPEGVETYPNWVNEEGMTNDNRDKIYNMRHNDSGNSTWWMDSEKSNTSDAQNVNNVEVGYQEKYKLRHIDSGERDWWQDSAENEAEMVHAQEDVKANQAKYAIRHQDSGEKAWWLQQQNHDSESEYDQTIPPLGDRASPEGLETPKDRAPSPYDNVPSTLQSYGRGKSSGKLGSGGGKVHLPQLFISKHTNIDEILGGTSQLWSPFMNKVFGYGDEKQEECMEIDANQVIIHEGSGRQEPRKANIERLPKTSQKLDDAALQLYKDGDYGSYLDLEASISEQQEEFEGFQSNKKNSIVLRTQLSVRVHTIIEKLLTSEGRELRRALFSLKQIFQEDKDLVHEFVQNDGLSCLIKVGSEADQNYQNYILRALGQVMLYVDGMNGVMEHNQTVQWLYSLISSKFRLVVKTALKLLLVFVEYTESNCLLLIKAIHTVDYSQGLLPYHNIMRLLKDFDSADTELLIYATTLINKVLNGSPDQDTYYDQVDALEEQGIETIIQRYMSKPGTDLDLLQQFQIYEAVLQYEDGEEINGTPIRHLDENIRKTLRNRKSVGESVERRKSRRHSTGTTPLYKGLNTRNNNNNNSLLQANLEDFDESSSSQSSGVNNTHLNGSYKDSNKANEAGVTPALKRRRERAERQRSFMREQQENAAFLKGSHNIIKEPDNNEIGNGTYTNALQQRIANGALLNRNSSRKDLTSLLNAANKLDSEEAGLKQPWIYSMLQNQEQLEEAEEANENEKNLLMQLKKENTVKDLTQKLANQTILQSPTEENKVNRFGDMSGLISKAKEGLAKSKSKADVLKSATNENIPKPEPKKSENEMRWEELVSNLNRSLNLCDMDFTDLATDDENDILAPAAVANGIPPPPPPLMMDLSTAPPPPPLTNSRIPPPAPAAPLFGSPFQRNKPSDTKIPIKKNKKTVKLFWKEVRDDPISHTKLKAGFIWDELSPVIVDTQKLEHLFESRAKDLITKKQQEMNKNKEIIVLDPKRSNAINIGMTKLPPPRSIKTAILKMDATVMNREGIDKLLTMLPTEEERTKIQEAQAASPDLPLGSAEQFLLTLASISELPARLKLWAFKLDFENSEREIAEPLMDLKQGFEVLRINKTFRGILSTLLSIGNFLNGNEVKGFQIDYLAKVPEVKDTVHKHSLLHHLCHIVMEKFPEASDLYSEIGAITRASKIDFDELTLNIQRLESDCKSSWDHLKLIAKHDGSTMMKVKMSDFLADCAERIILLSIIHRRIMNRFHKFLLWLGIPLHSIGDTKPNEFCRIVSEFALEYRTTRERVIQQLEKKANHRERNKTRGKMITEVGKFRTKEDRADAELRQLLGSDMSDVESMQGTLTWRRTRPNRPFVSPGNGNLTDGDDEILESLVKTATKGPGVRTAPRERKRTRHADRKSLKRSRTRENNPFGSRDSP